MAHDIAQMAAGWLPIPGAATDYIVYRVGNSSLRGAAKQTTADAAMLEMIKIEYHIGEV